MRSGDQPADADELLDAVGAAFARLRRRTSQIHVDPPVTRKDLSRNLVLNLVNESVEEMTVGGIAEQLGIDPSAASRMVSDCITAGYLERRASQRDGRRTVLAITDQGTLLRNRFRSQQRQAFEYLTRDWPASEVLEFARLLLKYDEATHQLTDPRPTSTG